MEKQGLVISQFLKDFDELLEVPGGTVSADQALTSLEQWDSMAVLGLLALADERYGVAIKPADLMECRTVSDIFRLLHQ